ncbi:MAG: PLP-dependent aspartate aminotransferase family protein [Pseudomonadota bacterium]|nr:PLP-dependent aspartate aminotransferase family protein [Pseudomonadota bacterium]
MNAKTDRYRMRTRLIHGRMMSPHWSYTDHIVPPISASTAYRLETTARGAEGFREFANPELNREQESPIYIYDRLDEPSRGMLEEILAYAEGGECCVTFATGMAAIAAALGVLIKAGDTLISHKTIYGCTYSLFSNWFPRLGIKVVFADLSDLPGLAELLEREPKATAVYGETPCNPSLALLDLTGIAEIVSSHNRNRRPARKVFTVIDNTFATPCCQRPIEYGIDVVVHSLTKNIGGFGTDMGGAVIGAKILEPDLLLYRKDFGGVLAPKGAWSALVYGLPTLALRSRQQIDTALRIARFLEGHPKVDKVAYPGLASHPQHALARHQMRDFDGDFAPGTMIYYVLNGEGDEARIRGARLMDHLAEKALSVTLAVSLGQIRTLVEHPASMTHASLSVEAQTAAGIDPGGIRLSIGLESGEDIVADLDSALQAA